MNFRLSLFIVNIFFLNLVVNAKDGVEKKTEHGTTAESGSGQGGAKDSSVAESVYSGKQSQQWSEIQTKLAALKTKLDVQEALVKKLNAEKNHLSGEELISKMGELKNQHAKWLALNDEYRKISSDFETKFPEKGVNEKRIYQRLEKNHLKSDSLKSKDLSLSEQLDQLQNKVISQYPESDQVKKQVQNKQLHSKKNQIMQNQIMQNQNTQNQKQTSEVRIKKAESEKKSKTDSIKSEHKIDTSDDPNADPVTHKIILKK